MSHAYKTVNWNRRKQLYDLCLWLGVALYIAAFITVSKMRYTGADAISMPIVLMRAFSTCAFLMLSALLCIGPLARINKNFLPLLYNRRHLGVSLFVVALLHAAVAIYWYHGFGVVNPIVSVFTSGDGGGVSFQVYGALALVILCLMAATSHDYWNANLGGPVWKAIHLFVYAAYALIVAHITFGALRVDDTGLVPWLAWGSVAVVGGLHLFAALARSGPDLALDTKKSPDLVDKQDTTGWVAVGDWRSIPDNRAVTVAINADERIAVFRFDGNKLAAVSNVCQHQNGPLGEGRVVDGLITCPWHGYQYRPEDGCSPPPFAEKVPTYRLRVTGGRVWVDPTPLPAGSPRPVVVVGEKGEANGG